MRVLLPGRAQAGPLPVIGEQLGQRVGEHIGPVRGDQAAGLPVGRRNGGYVFHHTRNTACTNMVGSGMSEGEAMAISGHKTRSVFDRYAIKREEVLRERLRQRTAYVESFTNEPKVVPLPR